MVPFFVCVSFSLIFPRLLQVLLLLWRFWSSLFWGSSFKYYFPSTSFRIENHSSICHSPIINLPFLFQSFTKPIANEHCELTQLSDRLDDHCTHPASSHMAALWETVCNWWDHQHRWHYQNCLFTVYSISFFLLLEWLSPCHGPGNSEGFRLS